MPIYLDVEILYMKTHDTPTDVSRTDIEGLP